MSAPKILLLALLGAIPSAMAEGWTTWENVFPAMPCQDGWAACLASAGALDGGSLSDAAGRPLPADARIGWFDLKPTAALSPFVGLSAYEGPIGAQQVAVAPQPRAERPVRDEPADEGAPSTPSTPTSSQPVASNYSAPSTPSSTPSPTSTASYTPPPTTSSTPPASSGGMRPGSPSNPSTTGASTSTSTSTPPSTPTPVASTSTASNATMPPATAPTAAPAMVATAPGDDSCDDLVKLEPAAMMGQLRAGQVKCLDGRVGGEAQQTGKDKISRLMITNAEAKGDKGEWERLMKRHLEDIDRSDPDMCFKYALHLSRGGSARAQGVIRWADYALENKHKWQGGTYKTRVFNLYKLRAEAANKLWQDAEKNYATVDHSEENEAKSAKYRGTAKDYAREWLDYAKVSAQDTKTAMALCVSAAGNRAFCEGG